jgi:gliding motility-associated lipoprotein GldD
MDRRIIALLILGASIFIACSNNDNMVARPRMYPRVFYPKVQNTSYISSQCPFTFNYPDYCSVQKDSFIFEGKPVSDCWFDLHSKDLNMSLHCSYYPINGEKSLSKHIEDAFKIAENHNAKANYRNETKLENKHGAGGLMFNIEGPVASPLQFFLTDEKKHFFRASLYFNAKVNPDSTMAILNFVKPSIDSLISTFKWK